LDEEHYYSKPEIEKFSNAIFPDCLT
jgi:hypothetical protein